jgi:hypothetical protein
MRRSVDGGGCDSVAFAGLAELRACESFGGHSHEDGVWTSVVDRLGCDESIALRSRTT